MKTPICYVLVAALTTLVMSIDARSGEATHYSPSVGAGACGTQHSDKELVAALPPGFWQGGNPNNDPLCKKRARVTNPSNKKSVTVRIRDKCPGCKGPNDIDLSPAAFQRLGVSLDVGRIKVNWDFV